VRGLFFTRNTQEFGYISTLSNSRLTLYYAYADLEFQEEDENEDDMDYMDPSLRNNKKSEEQVPKVTLNWDKQWELTVSFEITTLLPYSSQLTRKT
jgi:hypothetical protein